MEFVQIFTQMSWVPALLLIIGVVFLFVELFVPGFGFFGVSGIISLIAGIIVRIVGGLNFTQSLMLILMVLAFLGLMIVLMVQSVKHGFLGKSGLFERRSTLDKNYNIADKQTRKLVGKSGKTITNLNLAGKAKIRGKIYDVVSQNSYIEKGSNIKVVKVEGNSIVVRKWFE